jgi:hypothetical protein
MIKSLILCLPHVLIFPSEEQKDFMLTPWPNLASFQPMVIGVLSFLPALCSAAGTRDFPLNP